jgi:hypothetical protein
MPKLPATFRAKREAPPPGACPSCGKVHERTCAVPGCFRPGTITDSTTHECSGRARWVCGTHYRGTA